MICAGCGAFITERDDHSRCLELGPGTLFPCLPGDEPLSFRDRCALAAIPAMLADPLHITRALAAAAALDFGDAMADERQRRTDERLGFTTRAVQP